MSKFYCILFFLFISTGVLAQQPQAIDEAKVREMRDDSNKVNALNKLSFQLMYFDPVKASTLLDESISLAEKVKFENGLAVASGDADHRDTELSPVMKRQGGGSIINTASVAGLTKLLTEGVIGRTDTVVCILTGHELKDPNATVRYHTGIDMKQAQDLAPRERPAGKLANLPVQVDLAAGEIALEVVADRVAAVAVVVHVHAPG